MFLAAAATGYTITVVGATGGLGRELVQQSLDRGLEVVALCRDEQDKVFPPVRTGWLTEGWSTSVNRPLNVEVRSVDDPPASADAVIFALSGTPFAEDDTTKIVRNVLSRCAASKVGLVSAHGVGGVDATPDANPGIAVMRNWYLASTYSAKAEQEQLVREGRADDYKIWRPRVLAYSQIPFNSVAVPRATLAAEVLDWVET